jgi:hypothetical protein
MVMVCAEKLKPLNRHTRRAPRAAPLTSSIPELRRCLSPGPFPSLSPTPWAWRK